MLLIELARMVCEKSGSLLADSQRLMEQSLSLTSRARKSIELTFSR